MPTSACCQFCNKHLHFYFGALGQTMEVCDTPGCQNATPHHPVPMGDALPKWKFKSRSKGIAPQRSIDLINDLIGSSTIR